MEPYVAGEISNKVDFTQVIQFLQDELFRIENSLATTNVINNTITPVVRPVDGTIRFVADAAIDPVSFSSSGFWGYYEGSWKKLG